MIEQCQEIRQADNAFKLETSALFDRPDDQSLQTSDSRQPQLDTIAAFENRIIVDHEAMRRNIDDMDRSIAMRFTLGNNLVIRTVTRSTA